MYLLKKIENENTIIYNVKPSQKTIEEVLEKQFDISGRLFRKLYKNKGITFNGKKIKRNQIIDKEGSIILFMENESHEYIPENIPIDIVYEDYDLLIINKNPGIVVHPTKSHKCGTIANALAYYYKIHNIQKKIRFVNRLDMDTSGILVVAKNPFGHQQMSKQFDEDKVVKKYLVLVEGVVEKENGEINKCIGKDENDSVKNVVLENGKPSRTKYWVVEQYKEATLLEVQITTGRTHQIRVHMDHIGHPVLGDTLYNKPSKLIDRQALHSYSLEFKTPRTQKRINIKAELPQDINKAIQILKKPL